MRSSYFLRVNTDVAKLRGNEVHWSVTSRFEHFSLIEYSGQETM